MLSTSFKTRPKLLEIVPTCLPTHYVMPSSLRFCSFDVRLPELTDEGKALIFLRKTHKASL